MWSKRRTEDTDLITVAWSGSQFVAVGYHSEPGSLPWGTTCL